MNRQQAAGSKPSAQDAVLITGASSGIGLETALCLASNGFRVFASMRDMQRSGRLEAEAERRGLQLDTLGLDVTDPDSISRAVEAVLARSQGIFALVNNAGIQLRGYFEDVSQSEIRQVFETNLFGAMALTRAVLPHMRAARRGRIVLVTSVGGLIGSPALTAYSASKFALEGFGECLDLEVRPLGIRVALVEPAIVPTEIWGSNRNVAAAAQDPSSPYYEWFRESERLADWAVKTSSTKTAHAARAVLRALTAKRPRLRYLVGRRAAALLALRSLLPGEAFDRIYFGLLLKRITRNTQRKG